MKKPTDKEIMASLDADAQKRQREQLPSILAAEKAIEEQRKAIAREQAKPPKERKRERLVRSYPVPKQA